MSQPGFWKTRVFFRDYQNIAWCVNGEPVENPQVSVGKHPLQTLVVNPPKINFHGNWELEYEGAAKELLSQSSEHSDYVYISAYLKNWAGTPVVPMDFAKKFQECGIAYAGTLFFYFEDIHTFTGEVVKADPRCNAILESITKFRKHSMDKFNLIAGLSLISAAAGALYLGGETIDSFMKTGGTLDKIQVLNKRRQDIQTILQNRTNKRLSLQSQGNINAIGVKNAFKASVPAPQLSKARFGVWDHQRAAPQSPLELRLAFSNKPKASDEERVDLPAAEVPPEKTGTRKKGRFRQKEIVETEDVDVEPPEVAGETQIEEFSI